jgi:hypothetical protein
VFQEELRSLREVFEHLSAQRKLLHCRILAYSDSFKLVRFRLSMAAQVKRISELDVNIQKCLRRCHILEKQEVQELEEVGRLLNNLYGQGWTDTNLGVS